VDGRQAQVDRRGHCADGKQGVGELEERVGAAGEAPVERASEGAQAVEGLSCEVHNDPSCSRRSPMSTADAYP
jgi:hypothetical protein